MKVQGGACFVRQALTLCIVSKGLFKLHDMLLQTCQIVVRGSTLVVFIHVYTQLSRFKRRVCLTGK